MRRNALVAIVLLTAALALADSSNVVCVPNPVEMGLGIPTTAMDVWYLGGASDTLFAYAVGLSWNPGVVGCSGVTEGDLFAGCSPHGSWFIPVGYPDSLYVMCFNLGYQYPGTLGPGVMFTVYWAGVSYGESAVKVTVCEARNNENDDIAASLVPQDGRIVVSPGSGIPARSMSWGGLKALYR